MKTYETADFIVKVEERVSEEIGPVLTYRVRNKTTDVPEYEDYLLSRVIDTMMEMQTLLDKVRDIYEGSGKLLSIVENSDEKPLAYI